MSSNACRTVLFPEPESPVRMTRCREFCRACGFTGGAGSVLFPALVGAGYAHVFAVLRDGAAGDGDFPLLEFFWGLFVVARLCGIFFFFSFFFESLLAWQCKSPS